MNKIWKLFIDENIKIWKKFSTKLLLIVIILALLGTLGLVKIMEKFNNNIEYASTTYNWKDDINSQIENYKKMLENKELDDETLRIAEIQLEKCELALKYNINPYNNYWKTEILNEITAERDENNNETKISKLKEMLEKGSYSEYIENQKELLKPDLENNIITQQQYDDEILILEIKAKNEIGKEETDEYWKTAILSEIKQAQNSLRTGLDLQTKKLLTVEEKQQKEDSIKINMYRLEHHMPTASHSYNNYRVAFESLAPGFMISVIAIAAIIIAGGQISSEISTGSIKFWALTPNKRWKVLTAKLLSVLFYIVIVTLVIAILTNIIGDVFFSQEGTGYIYVKDGEVRHLENILYMIELYFVKIIPVIIFTLLAIMLSTVTRNTAVAVSFSVATYMGNGIFMMIINQFIKKDWIKFIPFNNLNIADKIFINTENLFSMGMTTYATSTSLQFSLAVLAVCAILMLVTMYDSFNHKDII